MTDIPNILDFDGTLSSENLLHIVDEKTVGTEGGTFTSGSYQTRTLNTIKTNTISGASLSSNQITLPVGTYYLNASAPAFDTNRHKTKLRNITDASDIIIGTSEEVGSADTVQSRSFVFGIFVITASKIIELQHRAETTSTTSGFGLASNLGAVEIYSDIKLWKVA